MRHVPIMVSELIEFLAPRPDGLYVDLTAGGGGHLGAVARQLTTGRIIGLDRDAEALEVARANTLDCAGQIIFRRSSFAELSETLESLRCGKVDGIIADLGVSMIQLLSEARGMSIQRPGPLDFRFDRRQEFSAWEIVNQYSEKELATLFVELGEERRNAAQKIARAISKARPVQDTGQLAAIVASVVPRYGRLHPATKVFQALRMETNDEPGQLDALLEQAPRWLKPGGRWVVISFHSLEDRKVKHAFRELGRSGQAQILTKHVVRPKPEETRSNPASRSAVLRALRMKDGGDEVQG